MAAIVLSSAVAMAQSFPNLPAGVLMQSPFKTQSTGRAQVKSKITLQEGQYLLGYYKGDTLPADGVGLPSYPGEHILYTFIPATHYGMLSNVRISSVRFGLACEAGASKMYIRPWSYTQGVLNPIATVDVPATKSGWNTVELPQPVEIPAGMAGLLVGFSYTQKNTSSGGNYPEDCFPLLISDAVNPNGTVIYGNIQGVTNYYNMSGTACIQAIMEADPLTRGKAVVTGYSCPVTRMNSEVKSSVEFITGSKEAVSSIDYTIEYNGQTASRSYRFVPALAAGIGSPGKVTVQISTGSIPGARPAKFTVTKINGNEVDCQPLEFGVPVVSREVAPMALAEEFTGTGCGWCPRGWVGMGLLKENMDDRVALVALHQYNTSDPMYSADYYSPDFSGAPQLIANRISAAVDPFYGASKEGIEAYMRTQLNYVPAVDITLSASLSDDRKKVTAKASTEFLTDLPGSSLVFVLTADGLTGSTSAWKQQNYYYQNTASFMGVQGTGVEQFCKGNEKGTSTVSLVFDDVMLTSSWNRYGQILTPEFTTTALGTTAQTEYTLTMPTKTALKVALKYNKLTLIAIALHEDGSIAQVAKCHVEDPAGINELTTDNGQQTTDKIYDLQGRSVNTAVRGLYIQNGSKVLR